MNIYVSASFEDHVEVGMIEDMLRGHGIVVTSDWLLHDDPKLYEEYANVDKKCIEECDVFLMYNSHFKTAGKFIEMGIAIQANKEIYTLGKPLTTVFKSMIKKHYDDIELFMIDMIKKDLEPIKMICMTETDKNQKQEDT